VNSLSNHCVTTRLAKTSCMTNAFARAHNRHPQWTPFADMRCGRSWHGKPTSTKRTSVQSGRRHGAGRDLAMLPRMYGQQQIGGGNLATFSPHHSRCGCRRCGLKNSPEPPKMSSADWQSPLRSHNQRLTVRSGVFLIFVKH